MITVFFLLYLLYKNTKPMTNFFELPQFKCLENLVGISQKTCDCYEVIPQDKQYAIRHSESGLFVDEHDGAVGCLFLSKATCGENDIWDSLIRARREAIVQMLIDVSVSLNNKYQTVNNYYHNIGEPQYSSLLNIASGKKSFTFKTKYLKGAKIEFSRVGFLGKVLEVAGLSTIHIQVKNLTTSSILREFYFDVKKTAGSYQRTDNTLYDMPIFSVDCDGSTYEISYDLDITKLIPYDNKLICSCIGVRNNLRKYYDIMPDGTSFGLMFQTAYVCDENYLLCALINSTETLALLVAIGLRALTMFKFINNVKGNARFGATLSNILSLSNNDESLGAFSLEYSQTIADIKAKTSIIDAFGCFTCNTYGNISKGFISVSDPVINYLDDPKGYIEKEQALYNLGRSVPYPYFNDGK